MNFRSIIARWLMPSNQLPQSEREARCETPAFDVAAFYAECREAERLRDIEAETDAGCARAKQLCLKRAAAAYRGIANAKVRG